MFERFTEKARRVIFFARYEAAQFGSAYIETEHLLLGLMREDNALAYRFLQSAAQFESIREQIEQHTGTFRETPAAADVPLSTQSKRVLSYAAGESKQMKHEHIGTRHLLLGLLLEEKCLAAGLLRKRGLRIGPVREELTKSTRNSELRTSTDEPPPALVQLLLGWEELGGIKVIAGSPVGGHIPSFAVYARASRKTPPAPEIARFRREIRLSARRMEAAIQSHDFAGARKYSDQERELRAGLRQMIKQHRSAEPPGYEPFPVTPFLCIEIIRGEGSPSLQRRIGDYLSAGVGRVWVIDLPAKRTYTVTPTEGTREFTGEVPWLADEGLDLDLKNLFI